MVDGALVNFELFGKRAEQAAERDRKHNKKIEMRDFWMEVGVMVLIGIEILLSLYGLKEGKDQAAVMSSMATSATLTATYMTEATRDLHELNDAQADSLKILKRQETDREAQLGRKPEFALYVGHVRLDGSHAPLKPSQETDTGATFDFVLKNTGSLTANKVSWRVLVPPAVFVTVINGIPPTQPNDLPNRPVRAFLFSQEFMGPRNYVAVSITFVFHKGHPPFQVAFNASALEIAGEVPIGTLTVNPRTPK
jgi:hypothetical protein